MKFRIHDIVKLNGKKSYAYLRRNVHYEVIGVNENSGAILLFGVSGSYLPENFHLVSRQDDYYKIAVDSDLNINPEEEYVAKEMQIPTLPKSSLYIAVEITEYKGDYNLIARQIEWDNEYSSPAIHMASHTSGEEIKAFIRERLEKHPDEKWLILHGNTLGEVAREVRFRSE